MDFKSNQKYSRRWQQLPPALTALFIIALVVLGGLSLRQHNQIEQLRLSNSRQLPHNRQNDEKRFGQEKSKNVSPDIINCVRELNSQVTQAKQQLNELLRQDNWGERMVERFSGGVCLIQGEYVFLDPTTNRPLNYDATGTDGQTPQKEDELPDTSVSNTLAKAMELPDKAEPITVQYTGTGFLVDKRGYIVTNKHVTCPWTISQEYQYILQAGYQPKFCLFRAFFPGHPEPFELKVVSSADEEDVALLYSRMDDESIPVLPCQELLSNLKAGQSVIVLGYPTGFDVLLARMPHSELEELLGTKGLTFEEMSLKMAQRQLIQPTATMGMCGRIHKNKILYDAPTTIGGSGAPVIAREGKVVAINTALMKGFGGSNFGIPIARALELLTAAINKPAITEVGMVEESPAGM